MRINLILTLIALFIADLIGYFRRANGLDDTGVWSEESTALENIAGILSEIQAQLENKQK